MRIKTIQRAFHNVRICILQHLLLTQHCQMSSRDTGAPSPTTSVGFLQIQCVLGKQECSHG